jgi:hypothetical protein
MKLDGFAPFLAIALLAAPAPAAPGNHARAGGSVSRTGLGEALSRLSDPRLEALRAGKADQVAPVSQDERAALAAAQASSPELLDLRAGDAVTVLLVVVLVVLILLLI